MEKVRPIGELGFLHISPKDQYLRLKFWNFDNRCNNRYVKVHDTRKFVTLLRSAFNKSQYTFTNKDVKHYEDDNISIEINRGKGITLLLCDENIKTYPVFQGITIQTNGEMKSIERDLSEVYRRIEIIG